MLNAGFFIKRSYNNPGLSADSKHKRNLIGSLLVLPLISPINNERFNDTYFFLKAQVKILAGR